MLENALEKRRSEFKLAQGLRCRPALLPSDQLVHQSESCSLSGSDWRDRGEAITPQKPLSLTFIVLVNKSGHERAALNVQLLPPGRKEACCGLDVTVLADTRIILLHLLQRTRKMEMQSHTYTRTITAPINIFASLGDVPF